MPWDKTEEEMRLRNEARRMRKWVKVKKAGVTLEVVAEIKLIWRNQELVMVKFDVPLCRNMPRACEILLSQLFKGIKLNDVVVHGSLADRLLEGLGPRYADWWMLKPLPVDGDLLPEVIPGYMPHPGVALLMGNQGHCSWSAKSMKKMHVSEQPRLSVLETKNLLSKREAFLRSIEMQRFGVSETIVASFVIFVCVPQRLRRGSCSKGDACEFAHGVFEFECWLHSARYRTES
ncbi:hypothetical protein QQ045_009802 [Rhodiola kirilowii]